MKLNLLFALMLAASCPLSTFAQDTAGPAPSSPSKRSAAELEKLVAPIALYPDPLLATMLPASVYPLEIVQAARFVADTNNLAKLDEQPWDDNVKEVARVPDAIKKLNEDLNWTIELGEAFLADDKALMDAIQSMRAKAQKAGTLKTTDQQIVVVTNTVVEKTVEQQVVVVTNTVVQIQPASTTTVYVPAYNPYTVYYPPPAYYVNPYPLLTFGAGMAMGAIIANNCNWWGGGCYHSDVNVNVDRNVNRNVDRNTDRGGDRGGNRGDRASTTGQKKWQPDQSRLNKSGASASTASRDARGWGGASTQPANRAGGSSAGARPSQPTSNFSPKPSAGTQPARTPGAGASASPAQRPASPGTGARTTSNFQQPSASRPSQSPSTGARPSSSPSVSRPSSSPGGGNNAFSGVNSGSSTRAASSRGSTSRSSGGFSGGGGGRGGGRGGGGRGGGRR